MREEKRRRRIDEGVEVRESGKRRREGMNGVEGRMDGGERGKK